MLLHVPLSLALLAAAPSLCAPAAAPPPARAVTLAADGAPAGALSDAPAACPAAAGAAGFALAAAALALTRDGRLAEALACYEAAARDAALPAAAREAVASNEGALRRALGPYLPRGGRLFHNFEQLPAGFPPADDPPPRARAMSADPAIGVYDGALSRAQCAAAVELFETAELFEGNVISAGRAVVDAAAKLTMEFDVSGVGDATPRAREWRALERLLTGALTARLQEYEEANPVLRGLVNPLGDEGWRMRRYRERAEHHAYHVDGGQERGAPPRVLAAIVYFNDVAAGGGGETVFLNHGREVAPRCGRVLIFPSAFPYVHAGRRVREGSVKYVATLMITL